VIGIQRKATSAENISAGEAICIKLEVVAIVDRPQDIDDDEAMSFFADRRAMPTKVRGRSTVSAVARGSLADGGQTRRMSLRKARFPLSRCRRRHS
jgi:hypothetical protein